jgi:hypothetical protein
MNKTPKEKIDYQKKYNKKNADKIKEYQKKYRQEKIKNKRLQQGIPIDRKPDRSRIYIIKIGDLRIKIGTTFIGSNRHYHIERMCKLMGFETEVLYFFDCRDHYLITEIEKKIKSVYCDYNWGLNNNSFKNEIAFIGLTNEIISYIESQFILNKKSYEVINFKK